MVYFEVLVVLILTLVNGLLAMSELAIVSSRKSRLDQMANQGSRGARAALRLIADPGRFLSTVQIGITLVGIVAGAFGGATLGQRLGNWLNTIPWISAYGNSVGIGITVVVITLSIANHRRTRAKTNSVDATRTNLLFYSQADARTFFGCGSGCLGTACLNRESPASFGFDRYS